MSEGLTELEERWMEAGSWWGQMSAQMVGDLIAIALTAGPLLWLESKMDAKRQKESEAREHKYLLVRQAQVKGKRPS